MSYIKRIIEEDLVEKLAASGAVLIRGPKSCGKTATAQQYAKSARGHDGKWARLHDGTTARWDDGKRARGQKGKRARSVSELQCYNAPYCLHYMSFTLLLTDNLYFSVIS